MASALTITVDETRGRLTFSRVLMLGSVYDVTWAGITGETNPVLIVTDPATDTVLAQTNGEDELRLTTAAIATFFSGKRPKTVYAYAYRESTVLGYGNAIVQYSPLSFDLGDDPEFAASVAESLNNHIASRTNPHGVTAAQVGAASTAHTHILSDLTIEAPDGKEFQMKFKYVAGQLTHYFEEVT